MATGRARRKSAFSKEIAALICTELASGRTLREVCRGEDMPTESNVRLWAMEDRDGFAAQYARAREIGYLAMADEILEIADDGSNDYMERDDGPAYNAEAVQRSRLRVDTRKWLLSKALPKIYGDKLMHTDSEGGPLTIQIVKYADDPPS